MTIYEFSEMVDQNLVIEFRAVRRDPTTGEPIPYYAQLANSDIKDDIFLRHTFGNGRSPQEAISNYVRKIKGQTIVFYGHNKEMRKEYRVPESLTA